MASIKITRDNRLHCNQFVEDENSNAKFSKNGTVTGAGIEETDSNTKIRKTGVVETFELVEED